MSDEQTPTPSEDVEAHLIKEALAAGTASAAIFAGAAQAGLYPEPTPSGTEDVAAELALIPDRSDRAVQQKQAVKKKSVKAKKVVRSAGGGGRAQPQ